MRQKNEFTLWYFSYNWNKIRKIFDLFCSRVLFFKNSWIMSYNIQQMYCVAVVFKKLRSLFDFTQKSNLWKWNAYLLLYNFGNSFFYGNIRELEMMMVYKIFGCEKSLVVFCEMLIIRRFLLKPSFDLCDNLSFS